jgi:hypothetical protein
MAIGVLFDLPGVTQAQYGAAIRKLHPSGEFDKLSGWPVKGVLMHVAGPTDKGWRVVDVWQSEEAFRKFAGVLIPILKDLDFPEVRPQIFPVFRFVKD